MTRHRQPPAIPSGEYIRQRRLERRLRRLARSRSLPGDPLAHAPAVADSLAGQMAALRLWRELPDDLRRLPDAWPMAAAYGRRRATP